MVLLIASERLICPSMQFPQVGELESSKSAIKVEAPEFKALNTELVGLSVDSLYAHIAWLRKIQELEYKGMKNVEVKFPLIEDITMEVAKRYGMIQPGQSNTQAVRAVFIVVIIDFP